MTARGHGRIVFWPGGSVWIGEAQGATDFHSHHAVQITLSLSSAGVRFRDPAGDWRMYEAALVPAHAAHAMDAPGQGLALVFAEPESRDGRAIQQRYRGKGVTALRPDSLAAQRDALVQAHRRREPDAALAELARRTIAALAQSEPRAEAVLDGRIARAIEAIRARLDASVQLGEVASQVHLSADRFRHLFLEQTGVRFRPYVLWLRIERAVAAYAAGETLTEAAHAGGFADSAHFSRTFRRMFGLPAAALRIE